MKSLTIGFVVICLITIFHKPASKQFSIQNTHEITVQKPQMVVDTTLEKKPLTNAQNGSQSNVQVAQTSCEAEINKYDWNKTVALAVAKAESGLRTNALNDNPSTGDYSVGCFQINLYGANKRNRPSEAELKKADINVAFAYRLYVSNGKSFIGQWGVCRTKVKCY